MVSFSAWLIGDAAGPWAVELPLSLLAAYAGRWFERFRNRDDLGAFLTTALGSDIEIDADEFDAVRRLFAMASTWELAVGQSDHLLDLIRICLPPRQERNAQQTDAVAHTLVRAVAEGVVGIGDAPLYAKVLATRIERLNAATAAHVSDARTHMDEALLVLHAELVDAVEMDRQHYRSLVGHLERALERLPPGPARRMEYVLYLQQLIRHLSEDPWPAEGLIGGQVLLAADLERRMQVVDGTSEVEGSFDADELAQQSARLVVLGNSGSGKSWFARRTARQCAERALAALGRGMSTSEVELPIYNTCSRFFTALGPVRQAAVTDGVDRIGDFGPGRIHHAVCQGLIERSGPTLLVLDSLDEADGDSSRLREVATIPNWRLLLTSRPSSWHGQLPLDEQQEHRVATLQPLHYPEDVEAFIDRWFQRSPAAGERLKHQLVRRVDLQRQVSVPLMLTFACILGPDGELPRSTHQLHDMVIRRLLTGAWRKEHHDVDPTPSIQQLTGWAWNAALSDPHSELGAWADDFPVQASEALVGVDHVAPRTSTADIDTGLIQRRFIHRSLRDHLVACHLATLPAAEVAEFLVPHLWFDGDWEYALASALAAHPEQDDLLSLVLAQLPTEDPLGELDPNYELSRLLCRVASETSPADWAVNTTLIERARLRVARSNRPDALHGTGHWADQKHGVVRALLEHLDSAHLRSADDGLTISALSVLVELDLHEHERATARKRIRELLRTLTYPTETPGQLRRGWGSAGSIADRLLGLLRDLTVPDGQQVGGSARITDVDAQVSRLSDLIALLVETGETEDARAAVTAHLIRWLSFGEQIHAVLFWLVRWIDAETEREAALEALVQAVEQRRKAHLVEPYLEVIPLIASTPFLRQSAVEQLEPLISRCSARKEVSMTSCIARLAETEDQRVRARAAVLATIRRPAPAGDLEALIESFQRLEPTADEREAARVELLRHMRADPRIDLHGLVDALVALAATEGERETTCRALIEHLPRWRGTMRIGVLHAIASMTSQPEWLAKVRRSLRHAAASDAAWVSTDLGPFRIPPEEHAAFRDVFLRALYSGDRVHGRNVDDAISVRSVAQAVTELGGTNDDRDQVRAVVRRRVLANLDLRALDGRSPGLSWYLDSLVLLAIDDDERALTRAFLLELIESSKDPTTASQLVGALAQLDPTASDLRGSDRWLVRPKAILLAAVRRSSDVATWLDLLHRLATPAS